MSTKEKSKRFQEKNNKENKTDFQKK